MFKTLRRLDSIHSKLVNTITTIEDPVFSRNPAENEWSIAEIVHHLCLVEERVIKELETELANPPGRIGFLRKFIPTCIVASRLLRVKAPKGVNPVNPPSRAEVIANYDAARSRLKELCSSHGRNRLKQVVFKHPFLGEIDGTATVSFIGYHELRHYKQIREAIKKLNRTSTPD
ncbi:MAG: DinB family protein [Acidobacteriota bacterium]|nr:DinB family protein [Acidobacteriota bacterium]